MLRLFKNKKGQNTAEYAILIALVVGGVIAMQTYAQRTMQARLRDASVMFTNSTNAIGTTAQYEPYYLNTVADTDKLSVAQDTYRDQMKNTVSTKDTGTYVDATKYTGTIGY